MSKLKVVLLQIKLLLKKNVLVAWRSWLATLLELLSPVFFILVLFIITKAPTPQADVTTSLQSQSLPACTGYSEGRCFNILFAPINSSITVALMKLVGQLNDPPIPYLTVTDYSLNSTQNQIGGIIGFENSKQIYDFVALHPNITQVGINVEFIPFDFTGQEQYKDDPLIHISNPILFGYDILWNATCPNFLGGCTDYALPMNVVLQKAINAFQANQTSGFEGIIPEISISTTVFPLYEGSQNPNGCLFFYCGSMISFIFVLYKISYEKEKKLKQGMVMMGLSETAYWISWFITCVIVNILLSLITIAIGSACQFDFFLSTNFFANFFLFFLFTTSMTLVAFFILAFISTTKAAIGIGMAIFIVGSIFQMIFSLLGAIIFQIIYETNSTAAKIARICLFPFPMFHFSKAITDINVFAQTYQYTGEGFKWSDLKLNLNTPGSTADITETYLSFVYMVVLIFAYGLAAWYFDHVIPGNDGNTYPPYFFLMPSYWGLSRKRPVFKEPPPTQDNDIKESIERANDPNNKSAVVLRGISKLYRNIFNSKKNVQAVNYLSLSIDEGTVLCLLGHNGSGKSTTIGMLTGLISPTTGDALIYGHSILNEIHQVRKMTSVCPQHDILFMELTVTEHLQLFCELKGIPANEIKHVIDHQISAVKLKKFTQNKASELSGGQRRRLSIAIACIGDPKIIYLDEPTSGCDSASKRHIWNLIKEVKKDRVVLLTSHYLDEVEVLSDKIVIMSHGQVMASGNSLQLKSKYADGYSVNIIATSMETIPHIKDFISKLLPSSRVLSENATFISFGFPLNTPPDVLISFFQNLEKMSTSESPIFRDWGVTHSTLDECFLKVTKLKIQ